MTETAIRVVGLAKQFHIAKLQRRNDSMRTRVLEGLAAPFRRTWNVLQGKSDSAGDLDEIFWAFRGISFEIDRGEVVGIIGRNGAGKTTLLKTLSRITWPTEGYAEIHGRVGSLLEVGTGFHPELSGRENIFLNGAILGMHRSEIERKLDEIIEFSEIGKFIDTPIKHYSSGMTMRLAFSVAAHLDPEIMIVDEVLAVGDASFQSKCLGKMNEVSSQGRTVLFVSHNMGAVAQLCTRVIWLEDGQVRMDGPADEVISAYLSNGMENHGVWINSAEPDTTRDAWVNGARLLGVEGKPVTRIAFEESLQIEVDFQLHRPVRGLAVLVKLMNDRGDVVFVSTDIDDSPLQHQIRKPGVYQSVCLLPSHLLRPGRYHITLMPYVHNLRHKGQQSMNENVLTFDVTAKGYRMHFPRWGLVTPVLKWSVSEIEKDTVRSDTDTPECIGSTA